MQDRWASVESDSVEPVYLKIEFVSNAERLWGKLQSGRWDWLGVQPSGAFVLGSPPASRMRDAFGAKVVRADGSREHGVRVFAYPDHPDLSEEIWCGDAEEARAEFERRVAAAKGSATPRLLKLQLILDGRALHSEYVVVKPSTYR